MALSPGTRVGPYEVISQLGAGGMGEVYRARDTRLDRVVAVKVLPGPSASDPDLLARFEREAKAVAALSHPGILSIFDFGSDRGTTYAAMELLEGESLRARLAGGPLSQRRAVEYALQVCHALAAAHEKGIVHRDLKPENLFITRDNRIKVLDFGLAKVVRPRGPQEQETMALDSGPGATEAGVVMGTVGYMSPEQVRGAEVDPRSDIFSFGSVLYEMLAGRRAFKGDSAVETMSAILKEDPPELVGALRDVNPALDRIVRHCLEKQPEARFQSARDLAFQLESLSTSSTASAATLPGATPTAPRRRLPKAAAWGLLVLAGALLGSFLTRAFQRAHAPSYRQLTFRNGTISAARFAPDETVVYSAAWSGRPVEVFATRPESPESRSLDLSSAGVLAVSSQGELALALGCRFSRGACRGTLARVPLSGGAPRELLRDVQDADWSPDGKDLVVVRRAKGRHRLEFPAGKVLFESSGWLSHPRFSPGGDWIAFVDHASMGDDGGAVTVVDRQGKARVLSEGWSSAWGLAWSPSGRELWFTAARTGRLQALYAVGLRGARRLVLGSPARLVLQDVSRAGRVLLARETVRGGMMVRAPGAASEQDLSWFDSSSGARMTGDGRAVLFSERGEGTQGAPTIYLRRTDGSAAVRLGEGRPLAVSPDGAWAAVVRGSPPRLTLLPTGAGEPRDLSLGPLRGAWRASFFPRSQRLLLLGAEPGQARRAWALDLEGVAAPRPLTPGSGAVEFAGDPVSPDERRLAVATEDGQVALYPLGAGPQAEPEMLPGLPPDSVPAAWSGDGQHLFVVQRDSVPLRVFRVELASKAVTPWREIQPADPTGIVRVPSLDLGPDGGSYVYNYEHRLGELFLAEGLR